jgi:hydroxylysine kinase
MRPEGELPGSPLAGSLWVPHARLPVEEATELARLEFRIEGSLTRLSTEQDDTFRIDAADRRKYVIKVAGPAEDPGALDLQIRLMRHVGRIDRRVPIPQLIPNVAGKELVEVIDRAGQIRRIRMMTWLEGTCLDSTDSNVMERMRIGEVLGRLRHATATFSHPADSRVLAWDVRHLLALRGLIQYVAGQARREMLQQALERYAGLNGRLQRLRTQVLHNDFSKSNILVDHGCPEFVTGIIDFGDAVRTSIAVDVATALLNQLPRDQATAPVNDLFAAGRDLLRGYLGVTDLTAEELQLIPHLVMARVVARALITSYRAQVMPDNSTYILRNTEQGWAQLEWFLKHSVTDLSVMLP